MTEGRILVVQLARLGDLVQTWPLLRRLRHQDPGLRLDLLADSRLRHLRSLGPDLDYVWEADLAGWPSRAQKDLAGAYARLRRLAAGFRERNYNLVYNLNFSRLSLLLSYLAAGDVRGYRPVRGGREFLREPWLALVYALVHARQVNRVHLSDVFRHLAPAKEGEPRPPVPGVKAGEPIIALQVATRHPQRTWPLEAFARLAGLLADRLGAWIWLLGTRSEAPQGEALRGGLTPAQRERVVNLQGRTDLLELAARLKEAHLLVSGDTGTLHLAAALGTRIVGVFLGPASCFETGPYGDGHFVFQAEPPCHPCGEAGGPCPEPICRSMIPAEAVSDLVVSLVDAKGGESLSPSLPAGARLYRSFFDPLGVSYAPLGAGARFLDLAGQAYRRAGARLLGLTWTEPHISSLALGEDDRRNLEKLAAALNNGGNPREAPPDLTTALAPLAAYREEMRRQQLLGRDKTEAGACLERLESGLRDALGEYLDASIGVNLWPKYLGPGELKVPLFLKEP